MKGSYGAISRTFATWSSSFPSRTVMASGISSAKDNEIVVDPPQLTKSPKDQNEAWLSYLSANGHPSMTDPNESILAGISRYAIGREWLRHRPKTTAGGNVPSEARLFTIPEIRRLCGFPDDFQLTGNFAQRWERMGRAVPPVMMSHVARSIRDNILND